MFASQLEGYMIGQTRRCGQSNIIISNIKTEKDATLIDLLYGIIMFLVVVNMVN